MANPVKASTQEHLDVYTIQDHLVFLKDGTAALVLQTTAINFSLLSDEEQDATIYSYAALINSLSFSIQILIRSQRKDITDYLNLLDQRIQSVQSGKVRESVIRYRQFIKGLVKDNRVLEKRFYVIIPFTMLDLGLTVKSLNPFAKTPQKPPFDIPYISAKAVTTLYPRRDHLIRQFARIGLKARQLTNPELISLFYTIYNPTSGQLSIPETPQDINSNTANLPTQLLGANNRTK